VLVVWQGGIPLTPIFLLIVLGSPSHVGATSIGEHDTRAQRGVLTSADANLADCPKSPVAVC
jgi:hypothetical protein